MPKPKHQPESPEPIGIVIAGPAREDVAPRFVAYVWGPAPEPAAQERVAEPRAA